MNATDATYEIKEDQQAWLNKIVEEYNLPDTSKALRILLVYAMEAGDKREIFASENSRCRYCG